MSGQGNSGGRSWVLPSGCGNWNFGYPEDGSSGSSIAVGRAELRNPGTDLSLSMGSLAGRQTGNPQVNEERQESLKSPEPEEDSPVRSMSISSGHTSPNPVRYERMSPPVVEEEPRVNQNPRNVHFNRNATENAFPQQRNVFGSQGPAGREVDPMLGLLYNMVEQMKQQQQVIANVQLGPSPPPNYFKMVMMMKNIGTQKFGGNTDPYEADMWLQDMEKNFATTRCLDSYKKDIAVYYLEKEALSWWANMEKKFFVMPTWLDFRREFERKYFPPEEKDRLETQFMELKQGKMSVREYEAEFARLRNYTNYGHDDELAVIRKFVRGLRPQIRSRLRMLELQNYFAVVEKAVCIEEGLIEEKEEMLENEVGEVSSQVTKPKQVTGQGQTKNKPKVRANKEKVSKVVTTTSLPVCYNCNKPGHFARDCQSDQSSKQFKPRSEIVCFACKEKGHYANECPTKNPGSDEKPGKAMNHPPPSRLAGESASMKRATTAKVYALDIDKTNLPGPSKGPIAGMYGFYHTSFVVFCV